MGGGRVLNRRVAGVPAGAVYVGRPSVFGNPFVVGVHGSRELVIERFREYAVDRCYRESAFRAEVASLHGRTLVCWCAPAPCHGKVLLWLAARLQP
jgi:hypothetical protein